MNINKLKLLIEKSGLSKQYIAEKCSISRPTLDNVLSGSDAKISTVESLSSFFNVPVGYFFDYSSVNQTCNGNDNIIIGKDNNIDMSNYRSRFEDAQKEIEHLKEVIEGKDKLLEEKERLINVLMNK